MLMVFAIWYVFAVASTSFSFPYLVLPSGALVCRTGGDEISQHLLVCKRFICPSLMKLSLAGHEIMG